MSQNKEFKNQEDDIYDIESESEEIESLNLSQQNLRSIPYKIAKTQGAEIKTLILTNNKLSSFSHLTLFRSLRTLQLDSNNISDDIFSLFPKLPLLTTLWMNNNKLSNLETVLFILNSKCPQLEYLSLLFNPLCPFINTNNDTYYIKYRHKVLSHLTHLKYLDISARNDINIEIIELEHSLLLNIIDIESESIDKSVMLCEHQLARIICHCSSVSHFVKWKCFYNGACDGFSKNTFMHEINTISDDKSIVIIKDSMEHVFGAYMDGAKWSKSLHYTGSMECFVFHFAGKYSECNNNLYIHKSSGIKPYYLQFNNKDITIGCGESAAIYFDFDFNIGRTTPCETFNSPSLTHTVDTQFVIHSIEIWAPINNDY